VGEKISGALTGLANLVTVVALLTRPLKEIVPVLAAVAIVAGIYLFAKGQWRIWAVLSMVASLLLVVGYFSMSVPRLPPWPNPTPTVTSVSAPTGTLLPSVAVPAEPRLRFQQDVRLLAGTGVDLDNQGAGTIGFTGSTDAYLDAMTGVRVNGGVSPDGGSGEQGAYARCAAAARGSSYRFANFIPVVPDLKYCFVTSEGYVAWLRTAVTTQPGEVTLTVRVWDKS
jgi:hypothetical protein